MFIFELQLSAAILLDCFFGDPRFLPHPVQMIGLLSLQSEKIFRKAFKSEYIAGLFAFWAVLFLSIALTSSVIFAAYVCSSFLAQCIAIILLYTCLAARGLVVHSHLVYSKLQNAKTLEHARIAVAQIVGRDTSTLTRKGIIRACVETVAENMVDGVTAPLFYAILFSLFEPLLGINTLFLAVIGAMAYKTVNTMDSMFGYKNERYIHFGRTAAKIDDFVNWLPARISGFLLIAAAFFLRLDWKNSFAIFKRDRLSHASPNAAHPESAVAGALGIELGGTSIYFGKELVKPTIGFDKRKTENKDILKTNNLMLLGSFLFLIIALIFRFLIVEVLFQ